MSTWAELVERDAALADDPPGRAVRALPAPGRTVATARLVGRGPRAAPPPAAPPPAAPPVQREAAAAPAPLDDPFAIHLIAQRGVAGGGAALPHGDAIQRSFGRHDVSGVRAHVGGAAGAAAAAIGARAYATGTALAFTTAPDLRQAAHEAAHVIQQRGGVDLAGGVGRAGDRYEQHADAVADRVVRGESAEALLDGLAGAGPRADAALQCDGPTPLVTAPIVFVPREQPTEAGRALQAALLAGIPADRRTGDGATLLHLLPALASILDPAITAARDAALVTSPTSPRHPQAYASDGLDAPYRFALWDYFKARWESDDRAMRRGHLARGHDHWWPLMRVARLRRAVATNVGSVQRLVHRLIERPIARLRGASTFDVLTHDGVALTAEQRAAREQARARAAAAAGARRRGDPRSERIDVAAGALAVTDGAVRTVRYLNPAALGFVPHNPRLSPNPRRDTFNDLARLLQARAAIAPGDGAALATADAQLVTAEAAARDRLRAYVRRHGRGAERDADLARVETVALTIDVAVRSHDVDVGAFRVHLEPVAPGALVERPGGFSATVTDRATRRAVVGVASPAVLEAALAGFSGDERELARHYLAVIQRAEGTMTSLNTWDRLGITLGSGLGAAGRLQDELALLQRDDPEAFERLFGRHGIGVEGRGLTAGAHDGSGNSRFTHGGARGRDATMAMADDPASLAAMVTAGIDPSWQANLVRGAAASVRQALDVGIVRGADGGLTLARSGGTRLFTWLHGHVAPVVLSAGMFSLADDIHGSGHLAGATVRGFAATYQGAGGDPAQLDAASPACRAAVGRWLVVACSHPNRRVTIARELGVASFAAITGG